VLVEITDTSIKAEIGDWLAEVKSMGDLFSEIVRFCEYTPDEQLELREQWGEIFRQLRRLS